VAVLVLAPEPTGIDQTDHREMLPQALVLADI
jgi:hypothetical protein